MSLLEKRDLRYDYSWTSKPGKSPRFEGKPDSNLFDKNTGDDVLYIINEYAKENNIEDKETGLEIEAHIRDNLEGEINTQRDVADWLGSIFSRNR